MRFLFKTFFLVALIIVIGWGGLWWYAQARIASQFETWASQTSANGKIKVTYDNLTKGTSPLAATVTAAHLQFTLQPDSQSAPIRFVLPQFALRIDALNPMVLHFDLPPQLTVSGSRGDGVISFGSIDVAEQLNPQALFASDQPPFSGFTTNAKTISLLAGGGSLLVAKADDLTASGAVDVAEGDKFVDVSDVMIDNLALSPLLTKVANVPFDGAITHLQISDKITSASRQYWQNAVAKISKDQDAGAAAQQKEFISALHDWAVQGGSADLTVNAIIGPSTLTSHANVNFDANVQPQGSGDISANHLDAFETAIASAYPNASDSINLAQAHLSPYLSASPSDGQVLKMHIDVTKSNLSINGSQVSTIPMVNWESLENPAPAQ